MNPISIVIDKQVVDNVLDALAQSNQLVVQYSEKLESAQKDADANRLLSIREACQYLSGIDEDTLLLYRRKGLNYYKKGRKAVWYRKGDIDAWLASGKVSKHSR